MATPSYVKKANNKYNSKFDIIQVKLDKGTKEKIKAVTDESYNQYIKRLIMTDLERLKDDSSKQLEEIEKEPVDFEKLQAELDTKRVENEKSKSSVQADEPEIQQEEVKENKTEKENDGFYEYLKHLNDSRSELAK